MRRAALFLLSLVAVPAALEAQKCVGQAPWSSGSLKVGGSIEFGGGSTDIAGGISTGKDQNFFFAAGAGVITDNSQFFIQAGAGKELKKPLADKIIICPIGNFSYAFKKDGVSSWAISGGLSGGYPVAMNSKNVGLILTGSAQLGYDKISVDGGLCDVTYADCSDVLGIFGFGAGFIFNNRISLVPQLVLPTKGDIALLIIANVAIGKH